jgi:uncharacterized membrane protein
MSSSSEAALLFEALVTPHQSLSRRGHWLLLLGVAFFGAVIGLRFWLLGAWVVLGFSVVEIGGALLVFHLFTRRARSSELVLLYEDRLRVVRTTSAGKRQEKTFSTAWLNVVLEEAPGRVPTLLVASRGVREQIGAVLGENERRDLAAALGEALHRARHPVFDNPQLRE